MFGKDSYAVFYGIFDSVVERRREDGLACEFGLSKVINK